MISIQTETKRKLYRRIVRIAPFKFRHLIEYMRIYHRIPQLNGHRHSERMFFRARDESSAMLTAMCSKLQMKSMAKELGGSFHFLIPQTSWAGPATELGKAVSTLPSGDWVLKPNNLGGGLAHFIHKRAAVPEVPADFLADVNEQRLAFRALAPRAWGASEGGYIIERKIGSPGVVLRDYKVHVFAGKARLLSVYNDREDTLSVTHFLLPYATDILFQRGPKSPAVCGLSGEELTKLVILSQMLAGEMGYIRIDFYVVGGHIWFGEFSPFGGLEGLAKRPEIDRQLGDWWKNQGGGRSLD